MTKNTTDKKALYPAQLNAQQQQQQQQQYQHPYASSSASQDERMARELQAQYDREAHFPTAVMAQPMGDMPFNCGNCGMMHVVHNAANNAQFQCTRCKYTNRIVFQNARPIVFVQRRSWIPIPIICNIQ